MGTPRGLVEIGRGGAYVPARVAPQGRIHRSSPCTMHDVQNLFWYENATAQTFGRARRHLPYGFIWMDCAWLPPQHVPRKMDCVWCIRLPRPPLWMRYFLKYP